MIQIALRRNGHVTAAVTFYGLALLAFGLLVALLGFVFYFAPIYDACASVWSNLVVWGSSLGALLPVALAGSILSLASLSMIRQWQATRRLLTRLASYRVPVPPRLARIAREVGLEDRVDCISGLITTPFCYGFIRPRVCVPATLLPMLDDSELRAVLRHEAYHAQSRDPLKVWLSRALARGLCFLPLAGDLRDSYLAAKEVAADETATFADELSLASALVKMLSAGEAELQPIPIGAGLPWVSIARLISVIRDGPNQTEERIRRLIDGGQVQLKLPSITSVLLSGLIVVAIFAASYANLSAAPPLSAGQECATERAFRDIDVTLTIDWPAISQTVIAAAAAQTKAGPVAIASSHLVGAQYDSDCELLTPVCQYSVERGAR